MCFYRSVDFKLNLFLSNLFTKIEMLLNVVLFVIFVIKRLRKKTKVRRRKIGNFIKAGNGFFKTPKSVENLENVEEPEIGRGRFDPMPKGKNLHPIHL